MGGGMWSDSSYNHLKKSFSSKTTADIFTNTKTNSIDNEMNPKGLIFRESRDSEDHPESLAIIIGLDVTGSMGRIPDRIAREKMGDLMKTLIKNKVSDAHILFCGIGDITCDKYPLQVGQFEASTELLTKWLTSVNLEGGGGGQTKESYSLAWLLAGRHTSIDCFEKRQKKGFLFTIGDEKNWEKINGDKLKELMGYTEYSDVADVQLLQEAERMYHVFHIHCNEGSYKNEPDIFNYWRNLLNERFIVVDDYNSICDVIATLIAAINGAELEDIVKDYNKTTALTVTTAVLPAINKIKNVNNSNNSNIIHL